mgnify:CR=1 FL=1
MDEDEFFAKSAKNSLRAQQEKKREMGLGPYPEVSLKLARLKRDSLKALVIEGIDPLQERDKQNIWSVIPGKFTLAFSIAPEFYRLIYKKISCP